LLETSALSAAVVPAPVSITELSDILSSAPTDCASRCAVDFRAASKRSRLVDLGAAQDALVAHRERLGDRRGGADDVDNDPDACRAFFGGCEGGVDSHAGYANAPWNTSLATATAIPTAKPAFRARNAGGRSVTSA